MREIFLPCSLRFIVDTRFDILFGGWRVFQQISCRFRSKSSRSFNSRYIEPILFHGTQSREQCY